MPTLREVFSNTADAIRTKTGKSDLISPPNFPTEIENISTENIYYIKNIRIECEVI